MKKLPHAILVLLLFIGGCQSMQSSTSLYDELGGIPVIEKIVDNFIAEISFDQTVVHHFSDTSLDRFRSKLIEQICNISNGPCEYSGDSMLDVHQKMNITEAQFNRTVDLLVNAMNKAGVANPTQNKLLARLAPMRPDIIYH